MWIFIIIILALGIYWYTKRKNSQSKNDVQDVHKKVKQDVPKPVDVRQLARKPVESKTTIASPDPVVKKTVIKKTTRKTLDKKHIKVVGTSFTDAEKIFRNVLKDTGKGIWNVGGMHTHEYKLTIQPDPENKYDKHAIAVISNYPTPQKARIKRNGRIGYLPKGLGLELEKPVEVHAEVQEGYGKFGVTVDLSNFDF